MIAITSNLGLLFTYLCFTSYTLLIFFQMLALQPAFEIYFITQIISQCSFLMEPDLSQILGQNLYWVGPICFFTCISHNWWLDVISWILLMPKTVHAVLFKCPICSGYYLHTKHPVSAPCYCWNLFVSFEANFEARNVLSNFADEGGNSLYVAEDSVFVKYPKMRCSINLSGFHSSSA